MVKRLAGPLAAHLTILQSFAMPLSAHEKSDTAATNVCGTVALAIFTFYPGVHERRSAAPENRRRTYRVSFGSGADWQRRRGAWHSQLFRSEVEGRNQKPVTFGRSKLLVADLSDIIASKRAADRPQDRAVVEVLEKTWHETQKGKAHKK
jgi:hypothetical protein